jgi:hypothetical protein
LIAVIASLVLAAAAPVDGASRLVHDGGFCAGLSWIGLLPGEKLTADDGPDFVVYRVNGPGKRSWGVYSGNFAQVRGNGTLLLTRDGVVVHAAVEDGKFRGYLAEKKGWQNHFFGSVFIGKPTDKAFFDRVDFGPKGQALCRK